MPILHTVNPPIRPFNITILNNKNPIRPIILIKPFLSFPLRLSNSRNQMSFYNSPPRNIFLNHNKPFLIQQGSRLIPWGYSEVNVIPLQYHNTMRRKNYNVVFDGI